MNTNNAYSMHVCVCVLTVFWTATCIRTAATAYITTAGVRTTLAPADPNQQQEENATKDDSSHKHPLYKGDKKDSSGNLVSMTQADPEGSAVLKSFLPTGCEVSDHDQPQGRV